ncbi:MAG TPA: hypothetical protein VNU46_05115 [Gemmatimonadaceae bacterium]|jgi:hypothetical protein|nr:hypothetical protein [Gemmatimonadaceae bacterium]
MTTYAGFDVLETPPNRRDDQTDTVDHLTGVFDPGLGKISVVDHSQVSTVTHTFSWFLKDRAEVQLLRDFYAARKGRAVPFWLPSWQADFTLVQTVAHDHTTVIVQDVSYSLTGFPFVSRRRLCFVLGGGTMLYRGITASVNNGDGTETLTIDSAPGVDVSASDALISLLYLCRMADDAMTINWYGTEGAECDLTWQEIPLEAPAVT